MTSTSQSIPEQINHPNNDIFADIFDNQSNKKQNNTCRFGINNYLVKIVIDSKEKILDIAIVDEKNHNKYFRQAGEKDLNQQILVLFRIFELFADKSNKVKLQIEPCDENAVNVSVTFVDSLLSSQCDIIVDEVIQSKEDVILFKLDQMEKAHKSQLEALKFAFVHELKSLHQLHETVVLLPGTSKVISLTAYKLILDGRDVETILNTSLKKIKNEPDEPDDEKKNDDKATKYQRLMPVKRTYFDGCSNPSDASLLANFESLHITPKDANGCHSCSTLCSCNIINGNYTYSRNKLLMVSTESVRVLDEHLEEQINKLVANKNDNNSNQSVQKLLNEQAQKFHAVCNELADVLKFCMDPVFVSFNGANIMALQRLQCIQNLTIHHNDNIRDISPIGNLKTLLVLFIEHCQNIQEVHCITSLVNLSELSFFGCSKVFDLTKLGNLSKLKLLDVRSTKVVNLVMFHKFAKLTIKYDQ